MTRERCERSSRRAILVASMAVTLANSLLLVWFTHEGWLGGTAFPKPLGARLLVYGILNLSFVIGALLMYERVRRRSERWALFTYLLFVATFSLVSIPVVHAFLARGIFVFGGAYSVVSDVTWGAAQYLIALLLYRSVVRVRRERR